MINQKICLSIGNIDYNQIIEHLKVVPLAEIRMDMLDLTKEQFISIFSGHNNLIATYRTVTGDYEEMTKMLNLALDYGCRYIDIDIKVPEKWRIPLVAKAKTLGTKVILSYHNFEETPKPEVLNEIIQTIFQNGANIAKIACMANSESDCSRITRLYLEHQNLVAFCMGKIGLTTRLTAPFMGAPFTYASIKGKETASGQIDYEEMELFLKGKPI
ncbi:MAG: type I 3-dehydroquinate dehydratase [Bacteroidales bacterium]